MRNYIRLEYDASGERYLRTDNGDEVRFTKQLDLLVDEEATTAVLGFSRKTDDRHGALPTKRPIPVVRIDGVRWMLDAEEIEVAEDCLLPA